MCLIVCACVYNETEETGSDGGGVSGFRCSEEPSFRTSSWTTISLVGH